MLILAYHGVAIDDEHKWNPALFVSQEFLRERLTMIRDLRYHVLGLSDALRLLREDELPERSIVLTFDDGNYDFYARAFPVLDEFGYTATVYLTTFYSHYQRPVFDVMVSYLLWKGRDRRLNLRNLIGEDSVLPTDHETRADTVQSLVAFVREGGLSAEEKEGLCIRLAADLDVDYDAVLRGRLLHIMTPAQVSEMSAAGIDFQLHTHRHRTPLIRELFVREIVDNRRCIEAMTGKTPNHFCYPSGVHNPLVVSWLRELNVASATTSDPDIASRAHDALLLPRLVDGSALSAVEFEGWLTGVASVLPQRPRA